MSQFAVYLLLALAVGLISAVAYWFFESTESREISFALGVALVLGLAWPLVAALVLGLVLVLMMRLFEAVTGEC